MDTVKAVISIGEYSIQLEGPQDFAEKYLEKYASIIESRNVSGASIRTSEKEIGAVKKQKDETKKRIRRTSSGPSCPDKIRELLKEGFFKEQMRSNAEATKALKELKGLRYESKLVSATLGNMFERGELERTLKGKVPYYYNNV